MIDAGKVKEALSHVQEPDLKKDLVTLNMIQDIHITEHRISFTVVLTTPACPLKEKIKSDCIKAIHTHIGNEYEVDINMTANVSTTRSNQINLLPNVKNIICVASGKGGVGKSTVAVNLAVALANSGAQVGLIDADIYGPSIPTMFGIKGKQPGIREIKGKNYILPFEINDHLKVLSIGLLVDERQAIVWRGAMVTSAIKQFITDTIWGQLDYLIVDMPPGTGDVHITMAQTIPVTGAIIVTTPQEVALADARKAIFMFRMPAINIPIIGVVENMAYFTPPELPNNKYYIFGREGGRKLAAEYEVPFLGEIPIVEAIRSGGDEGYPVTMNHTDYSNEAFENIAMMAAQEIAIQNAKGVENKINQPVE
jgi:ATP-binding protein involved in chromosome partitioning